MLNKLRGRKMMIGNTSRIIYLDLSFAYHYDPLPSNLLIELRYLKRIMDAFRGYGLSLLGRNALPACGSSRLVRLLLSKPFPIPAGVATIRSSKCIQRIKRTMENDTRMTFVKWLRSFHTKTACRE